MKMIKLPENYTNIPTENGTFVVFVAPGDNGSANVVIVNPQFPAGDGAPLVRVHSECYTGDVLGSLRCDCGEQLRCAIHTIALAGEGVVIYLRQEGRGIGLLDKLRAYNLQDQGLDTVDANLALGHQADERDYTIAACILKDLGVRSVQLMTNNPLKIENLLQAGVSVSKRVPLEATVTMDNADYLFTKAHRMHHMLNLDISREDILLTKNRGGNGSA